MYKLSLKSIVVAFFAMCLATSCQKSVKGKWTDADKAAFLKENIKIMKTDENIKMFNASDAEIKTMTDCSLVKLEAAYTPEEVRKGFEKKDEFKKIATECIKNTLLGKKGAWSSKYKEMMKVQINKSEQEGFTPEQQQKVTECMISKMESNIDPADLANSRTELAEINQNCVAEIMSK